MAYTQIAQSFDVQQIAYVVGVFIVFIIFKYVILKMPHVNSNEKYSLGTIFLSNVLTIVNSVFLIVLLAYIMHNISYYNYGWLVLDFVALACNLVFIIISYYTLNKITSK